MNEEWKDLVPGERYRHGAYFSLEVRQEEDGVYPFVRTGDATTVLPWRRAANGEVSVCLLKQARVDTAGKSIVKVCGGYNGAKTRDAAGAAHLLSKTGHAPDQNEILWWRQCLGVGPPYQFPIWYGFLKDPKWVQEPTALRCSAAWMPLSEACKLATAPNSEFFDDFSTAQLLVLVMNHEHW